MVYNNNAANDVVAQRAFPLAWNVRSRPSSQPPCRYKKM